MLREELIPGRWYSGVERLIGGIGLWDGHAFAGYSFKFGAYADNAEWFFPPKTTTSYWSYLSEA